MPRLIVIEGPRSGDSYSLAAENFLGYRGGQLGFSHAADVGEVCCTLRGAGHQYELRNHTTPDRVLVNGEAVRQAWLHHGDLVYVDSALLIFDCDEADASDAAASGFGAGRQPFAGPPSESLRIAGFSAGEATDRLLGTVSIKRDDVLGENINYRQKHYEDHEAVLRGVRDQRRMQVLFTVTAKISAILDLERLLNELLGLIFDVLPADRGSILMFDPRNRRLRTMASRARSGQTVKVKISKTIVKEVLRTKESLLTADAQRDQRLDLATSIVDEGIRSALCVPLVRQDQILGIIFLDTVDSAREFTKDDCDLLTAIAMQSAMALENARLVKEMGDRERIQHELNLATMIQKQLLPKKLPRSRLVEVYGKMIPAKEMSGDYFDFMDHADDGSAFQGHGNFHLCIGDVSGKGLPAGLVMIMARCYLRPLSRIHRSPKQILTEANRLLYPDTRKDMFMSALVLYWSDQLGKFVWSGAGHEHLIVYRARTRRAEAIKAGGCVLAAVREAGQVFQEHELFLEPGDALVLYTDGVTEAKNPRGEFFAEDGLEPLTRLIELYGHLSAKDLLEAVLWELKQFIGGAEQADDITVVTVKRPAPA